MSNEYGMLTFSKQPAKDNRSGKLKRPEEYFVPKGVRNRWYRAHSKVEICDESLNQQQYATCHTDTYRMGKGRFHPPQRVVRGSVPKTVSTVELSATGAGPVAYQSTNKDMYKDPGSSVRKVSYPYRNLTQVELGKDQVSYVTSSHEDYKIDGFNYTSPARRFGHPRNASKVSIGIPHHVPYIAGAPRVAMSMPEMDPRLLNGASRRPRRAGDRPSSAAAVRVGSKAAADAARPEQGGEQAGMEEQVEPVADESKEPLDVSGDEASVYGDDQANKEVNVSSEDIPLSTLRLSKYPDAEYNDHYHLDPLPSSAVPPQLIRMQPNTDRQIISRGSVNKMASQISIGWTAHRPSYVSHEHSMFKGTGVKGYVPMEHVRTKSQVDLGWRKPCPEDYVSVTSSDFHGQNHADTSNEICQRIMSEKRQKHTVDLDRSKWDGHIPKNSKYSSDFKNLDVEANSPHIYGIGKNGKTLSGAEIKQMQIKDPWTANPASMYETTTQKTFKPHKVGKPWRQDEYFRYQSQVNLTHPMQNKYNMMVYYQQQKERMDAIEADTES